MTYWGPVAQQAAYLSQLTGLNPVTAQAWLLNEGQSDSIATPSNPLNLVVRGGGSGTGTETGRNGPLFTYTDWQAGLRAAAALLKRSSNYAGIRAAIATGDPIRQAMAIEDSPWAGGNYGGKGDKTGAVTSTTRRLLGLTGPVASGLTSTQSPARPVLAAAPVNRAPIDSSIITGALLTETRDLAAAGPNRTPAQSARLALDFDALVRGLGGGSAAVDAVADWLGSPAVPQASPALVRPSLAGAPALAAPAATIAYAPATTALRQAPVASGVYDPVGLAVIAALVLALLALLVME